MRNVQRLMGLTGIVLACAPACSTKQSGQLMLAIQTDMSLPKDIDRIIVEVKNNKPGSVSVRYEFDHLGESEFFHLPATYGIVSSEYGASTAVNIRVIAIRGAEQSVRVMRDIVTTIPIEGIKTLPINLEFLCNEIHAAEYDKDTGALKRDAEGNVVATSDCKEGYTCVAGTCEPSDKSSEGLKSYSEKEIFGGGSGNGDGACFDTYKCFEKASEVVLDLEAFKKSVTSDKPVCKAQATDDINNINVALRTQGGGMCGPSGCFVALNADPSGWMPDASGGILLPPGVCKKIISGEVLGVVTAPAQVTGTCQKKQVSRPTCGPWSASGAGSFTSPDSKQPTLIASGQTNPVDLALAGAKVAEDNVVWTSRGTFNKNGEPNNDGTVKYVSFDGGQPTLIGKGVTPPIDTKLGSPHGIAFDTVEKNILWTNAGGQEIMWAAFPEPGVTPVAKPLRGGLLQPEGIAFRAPTVYWTELASQKVYSIETAVQASDLVLATNAMPVELTSSTPGSSPHGIAAAKNAVCWTYEDKLMTSEGVVACSLEDTPVTIATKQRTPRAIAMSIDGDGNATSVYWANFDAKSTDSSQSNGGIWKMDLSVNPLGVPVPIAAEEYPAGLAVDSAGTLFWTSRSSLGEVKKMKKGDSVPTVVAKDQRNPGAIVVNGDTVFWINEGTPNLPEGAAPDGAIMKIAK